jgi:hypothetical protein
MQGKGYLNFWRQNFIIAFGAPWGFWEDVDL